MYDLLLHVRQGGLEHEGKHQDSGTKKYVWSGGDWTNKIFNFLVRIGKVNWNILGLELIGKIIFYFYLFGGGFCKFHDCKWAKKFILFEIAAKIEQSDH